MSILDKITQELNWRESEISSMRIILSSNSITPKQKTVLLRAAWALLYAHYEGFCKNTLLIYYDFISNSGIQCEQLPLATKIFSLKEKLTNLRNLSNEEFLENLSTFPVIHLNSPPSFPDIDTQSNLWPNVLIDLLETANLNISKVQEHELKLITLVSRRNKIAHGEKNIIQELDYYGTYEQAVYDIMYDLAFQIDERISLPPFST